MKIFLRRKWLMLIAAYAAVATSASLAGGGLGGFDEGTFRFPGEPSHAPLSSAVLTVFGGATNGIAGGIAVLPWDSGMKAETVCILLTNGNPGETFPREGSGTNFLLSTYKKQAEWPYYLATNSFPGPMELRDSQGRLVEMIKPELCRPEAYPAQYSWSTEHSNMARGGAYIGSGIFPEIVFGYSSFSEVERFDLANYFKISEPGEYKFTLWPKIYKRIAKTNDLCLRIDVPPVTATIKVEKLK
jgi:hypothetical protein